MDSSDVKAFFEEVSSDWDEMRSSFYNAAVIDTLVEHSHLDHSKTVVDVGTGTGFVAAGLAPVVDRVLGVDSSPAMLSVARDNLAALGVDNAELVRGDVNRVPLRSGSTDAAVANMVLHHAMEPATMVREMARVTRPGGWVAVTDEVAHSYEWMRAEQADIWLGFTQDQVAEFFTDAQLVEYGYASLGMQ